MRVPNLPPAKPHSWSWSRSPRFQRAAAKPIKVTIPKKKTKTIKAVWFSGIFGFSRLLAGFGAVIDDGRDDHADENPAQLEPVEERKAEESRFEPVVERHVEDEHGNEQQEQNRPAMAVSVLIPIVRHCRLPVFRWPLIKLSFAPCQAARARALTAAQGLHDLHGIGGEKRNAHVEGLLAIDEEADMRSHPVLFVVHAESQPRIAPSEIGEQFAERGAVGVDLPLPGVGMQRSGNQHLHGLNGNLWRTIISR